MRDVKVPVDVDGAILLLVSAFARLFPRPAETPPTPEGADADRHDGKSSRENDFSFLGTGGFLLVNVFVMLMLPFASAAAICDTTAAATYYTAASRYTTTTPSDANRRRADSRRGWNVTRNPVSPVKLPAKGAVANGRVDFGRRSRSGR